ncbi:DUF4345 family protein [Vibrio sinaloensis]|nr:DUF4345 family protein [Vibrio sinaloensis]
MSKLLVYLTALFFFLLYGAMFVVAPHEMANLVTESSPSFGSAMIDFRATYGGAQFAIGAALLFIVKWKKRPSASVDTGCDNTFCRWLLVDYLVS